MVALNPELIDADILPQLHRELAEVIGLHDTLRLGEAYNGVLLYVPIKTSDNHPLQELIGEQSFEALVDMYGGINLMFPKIDAATRQVKYKIIARMTEQSRSVAEIALQTGYSQRRVLQIRAELGVQPINEDQLSFF